MYDLRFSLDIAVRVECMARHVPNETSDDLLSTVPGGASVMYQQPVGTSTM